MLLAGLDIETTGLDMNENHRLIQIGVYIEDTETGRTSRYTSDVRPLGTIATSEEALLINGFTAKRIMDAPTQATVDAELFTLLKDCGYTYDSLIPVGWNVVAFDMPFIQKELPLATKYFTYPCSTHSTRAIDLTALGLYYEYKTGTPYKELKKRIATEIELRLGKALWHDAGYDAQAAVEALKYFKELLQEI